MKQKRAEKGRAVFYSRDSGGKHEQTPAQYVGWACHKAAELGVAFAGTPEIIQEMVRTGQPVCGEIFFDYCVKGNLLSRPALDRLRDTIARDHSISHLLIPRRDRFVRPDDPEEATALENELRKMGVTIVFMNKTLGPLKHRQRRELAETLASVIEYDQSGRFLPDLAQKMIFAQSQLAKQGFSTGGRAPFGFRRTLVKADGAVVRTLDDGEVIRQAGHHVVWLPGPDEKLKLIRRILEMLKALPATHVARILNAEGIPSPDSGRTRKDQGVVHKVSGVWHSTTIVGIARNRLLRAVTSYGQRSMGEHLRMSLDGPRELAEGDCREDGKPKVVRNPAASIVSAPARFEPLLPLQEHDELLKILDQRAGSQRGKPRSRNPENNPLGGRIYDLDCTWPMYRTPYNGSFRYVCGLYQQSHSSECAHNHIDGHLASKYVLAALQQRLLSPGMLQRLEQRLRDRIAKQATSPTSVETIANLNSTLAAIRSDLAVVKRNLARVQSDEQHQAVAEEFEALVAQEKKLTGEIAQAQRTPSNRSEEEAVREAVALVGNLPDQVNSSDSMGDMGRLFAKLNVQMFLRFRSERKKKRIEQKLGGGLLTWGSAPLPIVKYSGPTSRQAFAIGGDVRQERRAPPNEVSESSFSTGEEEKSSGNVSRGDRI